MRCKGGGIYIGEDWAYMQPICQKKWALVGPMCSSHSLSDFISSIHNLPRARHEPMWLCLAIVLLISFREYLNQISYCRLNLSSLAQSICSFLLLQLQLFLFLPQFFGTAIFLDVFLHDEKYIRPCFVACAFSNCLSTVQKKGTPLYVFQILRSAMIM